jgi:hypothetical protein
LLENLYSITGKVHPSPADPQVSSIAPVSDGTGMHGKEKVYGSIP